MKETLAVLFVLCVGIFCLWRSETRSDELKSTIDQYEQKLESQRRKIEILEQNSEYDKIKINELQTQVDEGKKSLKVQEGKIVLLGTVLNENFFSLSDKLIMIQPNWKIAKMPTHLELSRAESQFLIDLFLDKELTLNPPKYLAPSMPGNFK